MLDSNKRSSLALMSGGLDSAVLVAMLTNEGFAVDTVSFDYGGKHNAREHESARRLAQHFYVTNTWISLDAIRNHFASNLLQSGGDIPHGHYADPVMKQTVVPFRNGIMLAIAAGIAESRRLEQVAIAAHGGDHAIYPDCRTDFMAAMRLAIEHGTYARIELSFPFVEMSKTDLVRLGHELKVPFDLTYSCYNGREKHCGLCGTCYERREAFRDAGVEDPTEYEI